jgi:thiol-disulfide isomerase/thioredoxin
MKEFITNLAIFVVFCITFSALTACSGTETTVTNNSVASTPAAAGSPATGGKTPAFPPLASGLADAEVAMLDGTKFKISDKKGKVLLVNIWGTWCGPCIAEMPHLRALQDEHGANGFEVIGLNIGDGGGTPEPIDKIKAFVEKQKLNYTIAIASNAVTNQFYAITKQSVVPQTILVDREGHLRRVFIGGGQPIFDSLKQNVAKLMAG